MTKKLLLSFALCFIITFSTLAQVDLSFYLPSYVTYDANIPTPKQVLGYEVGEWHVSHDQLVYYMKTVAEASDRIILQEYARSYENRPLMTLIITSPENHQNLEAIQTQHVKLTDPSASVNISDTKLVHWMGYSVHGNEASGSNAALVTAYFLAAAEGPFIDQILEETVILLDPSYNPDGLQRFSTWVNMHKSKNLVADPNAREFDEAWPGGRTNHYWFDLNRDWMPVQHPESQGRIKTFHDWKPNVLTDHHEMGSNSTFFFQPGIPSRKNPLTPESNVTMTEKIAEFHATALDSIGSLYYSEESFDDYYIGKGSTYPDINGSIGILFEQASSRGHLQENQFGTIAFPEGIKNHFVTSLSTLKAAFSLKDELLNHQKTFYREAIKFAQNSSIKAYVFGSEKDPMRAYHLMEIINQHDIDIYPLAKAVSKNGQSFNTGSYIVPLNQPQAKLIEAMFEQRTTFQDSLFYDVSTWTLPLAFNLPFAGLSAKDYTTAHLGDKIEVASPPKGTVSGKSDYAYMFEPHGYYTQRAVMRLLDAGIITEIAHNEHRSSTKNFERGSIVVPVGIQREKKATIETIVGQIAEKDGINVYAINTGLAKKGSDLGSRNIEVIKKPKIAVLVDEGVSSYEAGEVWHLLDQRYGMQVTLLPAAAVNYTKLDRYNKIVMVNGSYRTINKNGKEKLSSWVSDGGVIIAWKNGAKWLNDQQIVKVATEKINPDTTGYKRYVDLSNNRGAQVIGGSIFEAKVDLGHPLSYGLSSDRIPLFRNHSMIFEKANNPYANPLVYTSAPLLSGYVSEEKLALVKDSPAVVVAAKGSGRVIAFADNPNFRAFWYGTNKLFMNALFFGQTISRSAAEE